MKRQLISKKFFTVRCPVGECRMSD